ncbi:MFS transporter [Acinetobacter sp. MD2]|uniref:MFS transporter n=1 Tax=Acinetobacter sp. MD2 TaxID=2600066 RepID=UPI002D1F9065|nr:MFS transporter [Acinetobacter sp. MD2]MEB3766855.1 MFS transporter [Acinetobacter sp. MD2]
MEHPSLSESHSVSREGSWFALLAVTIAAFALVTSEFLPVGVLNDIATDLNISTGTAGLVITLPGIAAALSASLLSVGVKNLDRRYVLMLLTAIMVIANALTAFSHHFYLLLFSRLILGIAVGGFWATAIALSGKLAPAHLPIAKATAIVMAGVTFASVLGVPIGTWLSSLYGWRSAFGVTAIIGALVFVIQIFCLPKLIPESAIQLKDLPALLRVKKARIGIIIVLLIGLAHFCAYSYLAPFFKHVAGFHPSTISTLLLLYGVAGIVGNAFSGYSGNLNIRYTLAFIGLCFAVVFLGFPLLATHTFGAFILTALWGFAFGAFPTAGNIWMFLHAPHAVEKGMPLFVSLFQVMIAVGSLFGGMVVDHFNESTLLYGVLSFIVLAIICLFTLARGLNNPKPCSNT